MRGAGITRIAGRRALFAPVTRANWPMASVSYLRHEFVFYSDPLSTLIHG
jgi:hypothetical protein